MATPAKIVLEQALALTSEQRLDLAAELLASVNGEPPATFEAAWRAELDDRMREVETGAVRPVPWAEARARLRARLAGGWRRGLENLRSFRGPKQRWRRRKTGTKHNKQDWDGDSRGGRGGAGTDRRWARAVPSLAQWSAISSRRAASLPLRCDVHTTSRVTVITVVHTSREPGDWKYTLDAR